MPSSPDVKAVVMGYLAAHCGVPVVSSRPDGGKAPVEFVRVISTGGPGRRSSALTVAQVTVDSYSASTGKAMTLGLRVHDLVHAMPADTTVPVCVVAGSMPGELPDDTTAQARVSATYQVTARLS